MADFVQDKIENVLNLHRNEGFQGCVTFFIEYMEKVLDKLPNKPSPSDKFAAKEFDFLYKFTHQQNEKHMTPLDVICSDWFESHYCDICFKDTLHAFYDYLNPKKDIAFDSAEILRIIKTFKEENVYEPRYYLKKFELKEGKFVVVDPKYKFCMNEVSNDLHDKKVEPNKSKPDFSHYKKDETKRKHNLMSSVISSFIDENN